MNTKHRLESLMKALPGDIDGALITARCNRLYYTGMSSSAGTLLVTKEAAYLIIDFRYIEKARATVQSCEVILEEKRTEQILALVKKHSLKNIAIESERMTVSALEKLRSDIPDCSFCGDERLERQIARQRSIKSVEELAAIRAAQSLTDQSFTHILEYIRPGQTEREIMLELEFYSRRLGSEGPSFDFIVVSGKNSSLPHGVPSDKVVEKGDFITMDFGCIVENYHSDMTRTVAVGTPTHEMREVYKTVLRANRESMEAIVPGAPCKSIDEIARKVIYSAGYEGCFGHGLGHAVGLEIHEEPRFNEHASEICEPGLLMTVEPGVYLPGKFGCRIEDMVYITENGCENLTNSEKELIIL